MLLACQLDPTLRRGTSTVLRCEPLPEGGALATLDDAVLYPEGGGQPADRGTLAGVAVLDVQKHEGALQVRLAAPVALGPAEVEVDWARRWDLTCQHSAQHLLTALAVTHLGRETLSFHLGAESCLIDLAGPPLSEAELIELSEKCRDAIQANLPLRLHVIQPGEAPPEGLRSRLLPEGLDGPLRLVEIEGLDLNTCGGTHVRATGQLGVVALTRAETYKGGTRLHYLAGDRVRQALEAASARERALSALLSCGPEAHEASVARVQDSAREAQRAERTLRGELAELLGARLAFEGGPLEALRRPEADLRFLQSLARAALERRPEQRLVLSGEGVFLVAGPEDWVKQAGPLVAQALEGRGGGARGRYQGKAEHPERLEQALAALG
ncbi:MAG: hypothetical protein H6741_11740 [Alphaproteobacteria bacterium]|nr:hypothetical protein [Alphaproteobacteria bacterium]MCB9793383.1 hypothetical protein [Alphaproteobacteria bacterium]